MADDRPGVTVWTAPVASALGLPHASEWLGEDESGHASRLGKAGDRDRYLAARILLRHALTQAAGGAPAPASWSYRAGEHGKLFMAPGLTPLEFNISHAGNCVAVAVSETHAVGVDVESALPDARLAVDDDALSDRERALIRGLPQDRRWETFLQLWTIKEACAKAAGLGAALDFRALEVSLDPPRVGAPPQLPGGGQGFDVATREAVVGGSPYRVSAAAIAGIAGTIAFSFSSLTP